MEKSIIGNAEIYQGDCLEVMPSLADNSIDAIITDPPYYKVKGEAWDNQWDNPQAFLAWVASMLLEFERILKPNGSLYFFASSKMAARVEIEISKRFNVLNNITWRKGKKGLKAMGWGGRQVKKVLRRFFVESEKIIFAEHYGCDNIAKGEAGYIAKCDELRGFVFEPLLAYLAGEWSRAGLSPKQAGEATGSFMGRHYFTSSQWALPTRDKYDSLRQYAKAHGLQNKGDYLNREHDDLKREHDDLKREYDDLKREYDDLRRPFNVTCKDQWSDVWEFDPVLAYNGKHPCEKPLPLLLHMINASTTPGAVVFDPFTGGGSLGHACHIAGRVFVGAESCPDNFRMACERIENAQRQARLAI